MRVLHLYSGNLYGGIERMLVTLAEQRACAPEMEPHFGLCFEGQLARELRETGAPVHMLGNGVRFSRPWTVMGARRRLRDLLAGQHFDVSICHSAWPHALFGSTVRRVEIALVHWVHGPSDSRHWLYRRARRVSPDLVIANSLFTRESVPNAFGEVQSEVIYCPVSQPPSFPDAREQVRRELLTDLSTVVLVIASRMEEWKGHRMLLRALKGLADVPRWECWIAGAPQRPSEHAYFDELRAMASDLPVKFLGHRTDLPRILAAADIHCQPNTGPEPFGVVFVEALYAALPVVTTRTGGATEIVNSSCGILVGPGVSDELRTALAGLIRDPQQRSQLAANGPARAKELCSPSLVIPMLHELLDATRARRSKVGVTC